MGLTVLWASGTHSNLSKSLIFDFIYKRYIDETVCITPVYLKISEKTREEKCGSLSIVKSMQNSQKRKQIQVCSCKGVLLLMFSKPPNPQWPVKMNTLTFRGKKYYFASWFFSRDVFCVLCPSFTRSWSFHSFLPQKVSGARWFHLNVFQLYDNGKIMRVQQKQYFELLALLDFQSIFYFKETVYLCAA